MVSGQKLYPNAKFFLKPRYYQRSVYDESRLWFFLHLDQKHTVETAVFGQYFSASMWEEITVHTRACLLSPHSAYHTKDLEYSLRKMSKKSLMCVCSHFCFSFSSLLFFFLWFSVSYKPEWSLSQHVTCSIAQKAANRAGVWLPTLGNTLQKLGWQMLNAYGFTIRLSIFKFTVFVEQFWLITERQMP